MAQGRCGSDVVAVVVLLLVVSCCVGVVQGMDYTVGDAQGWTKPNGNSIPASYLADWAKGKTFSDGDTLIFNYNAIAHNVLQVSATDYAGCIATSPLVKSTTGKDTVKLAAGTTYYFICGTGGHCDAGQKITITTSGTPTSSTNSAAASGNLVAAALLAVGDTPWSPPPCSEIADETEPVSPNGTVQSTASLE